MLTEIVQFTGLSAQDLALAVAITLCAGFVKGAVGFAMPLIMISAFSGFLDVETALAGLILPTIVTNLSQALRQGLQPFIDSVITYRRFIIGTVVFMMLSAPLLIYIPRMGYLIVLGAPITLYAALQLGGVPLTLRLNHRAAAEWGLGVIGGLYGGISGIWGPPFLVYLLSTHTPKVEMVRAQGVVFLIGAVALLVAHLQTGVANGPSLAFSAVLVLPAMIGMQIGYRLQDRLDANRFRRWTQILLVISGLNLLRQAFS